MESYSNIDMCRTGKKIAAAVKEAGFDVPFIQKYLHLSCPQPIYRWFKGQVLPSVDHLYVLSRLLGVHMEDLIVPKQKYCVVFPDSMKDRKLEIRLLTYHQKFFGLKVQ